MREVRVQDAVGMVLCHDITEIVRGERKGARFRKGDVIRAEDVPVLLRIGKEHIYVWEDDPNLLHENDAAAILRDICQSEHMAAKRTADMIPLCHPLPLAKCSIDFTLEEVPRHAVYAAATVKVTGETGVEMEALHAVSTALLTIYDMCKAIDKRMEITDIRLERKSGGKSGTFVR